MRRTQADYLESLARNAPWNPNPVLYDSAGPGYNVKWKGPHGGRYLTWGLTKRHALYRMRRTIGSWSRHLRRKARRSTPRPLPPSWERYGSVYDDRPPWAQARRDRRWEYAPERGEPGRWVDCPQPGCREKWWRPW